MREAKGATVDARTAGTAEVPEDWVRQGVLRSGWAGREEPVVERGRKGPG